MRWASQGAPWGLASAGGPMVTRGFPERPFRARRRCARRGPVDAATSRARQIRRTLACQPALPSPGWLASARAGPWEPEPAATLRGLCNRQTGRPRPVVLAHRHLAVWARNAGRAPGPLAPWPPWSVEVPGKHELWEPPIRRSTDARHQATIREAPRRTALAAQRQPASWDPSAPRLHRLRYRTAWGA